MILLLLLACECEGDLREQNEFEPVTFADPGTWHVCAGSEVDTELQLVCDADDEPYVFIGAGVNATILDASENGGSPAFTVFGCTLELRNLTVRGAHVELDHDACDPDGVCSWYTGGAFDFYDATVTLTQVRVTGNYADLAGAGFVYDGSLVLVASDVSGNENGGFAVFGDATLESIGTSWSDNDGDVVLFDGDTLLDPDPWFADGATDFSCDAEGCG